MLWKPCIKTVYEVIKTTLNNIPIGDRKNIYVYTSNILLYIYIYIYIYIYVYIYIYIYIYT